MERIKKAKSPAKRLKVVVLGLRGIPFVEGGVETHCEKLYPLISQRGADVTIVSRKRYVGTHEYSFQGVRIVPVWAPNKSGREAFIHTLLGVFVAKRMKPDILHIHAIGPSIFAPLARLMGMKVVVTHHGADYERSKWGLFAKTILRIGEWFGVRFGNHVIVISQTIKDSVSRRFRKARVHLIPNGVIPPPNDSAEEIAATLNRCGIGDKPYILAVGRVVPEKGFHDLVEALGARDDFNVVIAGTAQAPTTYSLALQKRAAELGVTMLGFVSGAALRHIYRGAALFVLPSMHEGLPIVLLEAMSYDKRILASDIPANLNVGLPKNCYFKVGDIKSLRESALREIKDQRKVSYAAVLKKRYNWNDIAKQTFAVYREALKK